MTLFDEIPRSTSQAGKLDNTCQKAISEIAHAAAHAAQRAAQDEAGASVLSAPAATTTLYQSAVWDLTARGEFMTRHTRPTRRKRVRAPCN